MTNQWNGPDPVLIWAKGHACIYDNQQQNARWLPDRLIKLASPPPGNNPEKDPVFNFRDIKNSSPNNPPSASVTSYCEYKASSLYPIHCLQLYLGYHQPGWRHSQFQYSPGTPTVLASVRSRFMCSCPWGLCRLGTARCFLATKLSPPAGTPVTAAPTLRAVATISNGPYSMDSPVFMCVQAQHIATAPLTIGADSPLIILCILGM